MNRVIFSPRTQALALGEEVVERLGGHESLQPALEVGLRRGVDARCAVRRDVAEAQADELGERRCERGAFALFAAFCFAFEAAFGEALKINAGHALSLQYHNLKDETIYLQTGKMLYEIEIDGVLTKREMLPGDCIHVSPKTVHRMTAILDCDVFEVSTPELLEVMTINAIAPFALNRSRDGHYYMDILIIIITHR